MDFVLSLKRIIYIYSNMFMSNISLKKVITRLKVNFFNYISYNFLIKQMFQEKSISW